MSAEERYADWLSQDVFDATTKAELTSIAGQTKEIEDRFYKDLEFGTAGLRGVIGAGTNRMNLYTVRKATQGLANYIKNIGESERGVAISYDSRHMSPEFADEAALCLAANGIPAFVFPSLRPTPVLSFAVRYKKAIAGINITASHNPPEYNGYKVYWEDGAQITPPHDTGIMKEVAAISDYAIPKTMEKEQAKKEGLYQVIGDDLDDAYNAAIKQCCCHPEVSQEIRDQLSIVYTPLHGTGNLPVNRVLKELGFHNVYTVPEQELPDGDFPTVSYPNPETKEAFQLGLALAKEKNADLVLATDPDADRLGVYVKDAKGEYHALTGNMSGCLLGYYVIEAKKEKEGLPKDGAFVKSIVSTRMADAIAAHFQISLIEVLTGFKYIGEKILSFEQNGDGTYLFGMEESYGCLPDVYARDKDAVVASMLLCEAAAYYKQKGMTLWDAMISLYELLGYYREEVSSLTLSGKEGIEKIGRMMVALQKDAPTEIAGLHVLRIRDYQKDSMTDTATGKEEPTGLPKANVLYYELENDSWVCVRPSGTEPKIKFYYGIKGASMSDADQKAAEMKDALEKIIDLLQKEN